MRFTSRGGTLHVERGCTSRREEVLFTLRGSAFHVERGGTSRPEGVLFTSRGGTVMKNLDPPGPYISKYFDPPELMFQNYTEIS